MKPDFAHCRDITQRHARTFWLAARLLPEEKRRAVFALYAFCRTADDVVDLESPDSDRARQLASVRHQLDQALAGAPQGPIFREVARVVTTYHLPHSLLHELLDGVARDLGGTHYARWSDLSQYCEGVASSVGEMCASVFGVPGSPADRVQAVARARTLGVAMQLTNILRDVGEDARRGRCYLPDDELARFGLARDDVLLGVAHRHDGWMPFMQFQIARARALYAEARPGIGLLAADARRCALACALGYAAILDGIEALGYDSVSTRASVRMRERAVILWRAWRTPLDGSFDSRHAMPGTRA